jgi:16S rRNA G966 N2-methylase RsmD
VDHLTPARLRAYAIADNRLAEKAGWDQELLALELAYIAELDIEFDLSLTGFEIPEIDLILTHGEAPEEDPDDDPALIEDNQPPVSRPGELWQLGQHRILCGDATDPASYRRLLGEEKAHVVFTDPPYNVPIQGNVSGLGVVKHCEFVMASGEMSSAEFTEFLTITLGNLTRHSVDGAIHFVCMDWRHISEIMAAGQEVYTELKNLCIWNKANGGMGALYRSKHELVFVFKHGTAQHINNVQLGRHGRNRTNVWDYPGATSLHPDRKEELAMHPTVKPVAMVSDAIMDCSDRGDIVLDCFGGSGTTLLAAERTGRRGRLIEISPEFVDVTIRRFEKITGIEAFHIDTGEKIAHRDVCDTISPENPAGGKSHG